MLELADSTTARVPRRSALFLTLVFGTTWLFQLPMILGSSFGGLVVLGFFAPFMIALALAAQQGRTAVRALFQPLAVWRVHAGYYLLALALPCVIFFAVRALAAAFGGSGPWVYPPTKPEQLAAMLLIPFTEQVPWRRYLYPRLESARGPLLASVITGFAWGLFHVQKHAFIDPYASWKLAALALALMTAGTIVFSWFYRRSGGSLLLVIVAHAGAYLNNPIAALPDLRPLALYTFGYCVIALALVAFDRETWRTHDRLRVDIGSGSA